MAIYKTFKSNIEDLQKRINRITKKLAKNNFSYTFQILSESVEEVNVWDYSNPDNIPSWQFTPTNKGKIPVEVVTYEFEMEKLQLGNFEVLAVIEHNLIVGTDTECQRENMIHIIKDNATVPEKYRHVNSICEHCNSNRSRNKTVLLINSEGYIKQVGTTCIKEYTGIDGLDIIKAYSDIHDIIIEASDLNMDYSSMSTHARYTKTLKYLAFCVSLILQDGYNKEVTKYAAWELSIKETPSQQYIDIATQIIAYFANKDFAVYQNFENNIKVALLSEYTKTSGFVAYAYITYQKLLEIDAKKAMEAANTTPSNFYGIIGDKIQLELTYSKSFAYETMYGMQHIHIFTDSNGNVFKWKTNKNLWNDKKGRPEEYGNIVTIKGTIKGHEIYNDVKQTELTRCKLISMQRL